MRTFTPCTTAPATVATFVTTPAIAIAVCRFHGTHGTRETLLFCHFKWKIFSTKKIYIFKKKIKCYKKKQMLKVNCGAFSSETFELIKKKIWYLSGKKRGAKCNSKTMWFLNCSVNWNWILYILSGLPLPLLRFV